MEDSILSRKEFIRRFSYRLKSHGFLNAGYVIDAATDAHLQYTAEFTPEEMADALVNLVLDDFEGEH